MIRHVAAVVLVALAVISPGAASSETVELVGGEWVVGALREATPAGVLVDVGGQTIKFPLDKVRAIYFGPPSAPAPSSLTVPPPPAQPRTPSTATEALQVVKSLRSTVQGGPSFPEYQAKVGGAADILERYLAGLPDRPEIEAIRDALRYYVLAESAWSNQGVASRTVWLRKDAALDRCPGYQDFARDMQSKGDAYYDDRVRNYVVIADGVISVLWSCASGKVTEAETLAVKARGE